MRSYKVRKKNCELTELLLLILNCCLMKISKMRDSLLTFFFSFSDSSFTNTSNGWNKTNF